MIRSGQRAELVRVFKERCQPLSALPTSLSPQLPPADKSIRAVLFDIYGTLVCSNVGDISLDQTAQKSELLRDLITDVGFPWRQESSPVNLATVFNKHIQAINQTARAKGIPHPEVDILEVWSHLIANWTGVDLTNTSNQERLQRLAVEYECAVNPVWPSTGLEDVLATCQQHHCVIGLVSNAQFYTPIMMESFLGKTLEEAGFPTDLQVWSYQERRGKPDSSLFEKIARNLETRHGIAACDALFVGNDCLKDVWAASQAGFRGVLYAGDARSLRLRENDPRCRDLIPYATVTSLAQIPLLIQSTEH